MSSDKQNFERPENQRQPAVELEQKFKNAEGQEMSQDAERGSDLPNRQMTIAHNPGGAVDADLSDRT